MQFHLGEVWKSVEEGGEPRRAIVAAVKDGGREGTLFFDNGDERSLPWLVFTSMGEWQVDTSPKPTRTADELRQFILQIIQRHPVCPPGMGVEIRVKSGDDWEALPLPPAEASHTLIAPPTSQRSQESFVCYTEYETSTPLSRGRVLMRQPGRSLRR